MPSSITMNQKVWKRRALCKTNQLNNRSIRLTSIARSGIGCTSNVLLMIGRWPRTHLKEHLRTGRGTKDTMLSELFLLIETTPLNKTVLPRRLVSTSRTRSNQTLIVGHLRLGIGVTMRQCRMLPKAWAKSSESSNIQFSHIHILWTICTLKSKGGWRKGRR